MKKFIYLLPLWASLVHAAPSYIEWTRVSQVTLAAGVTGFMQLGGASQGTEADADWLLASTGTFTNFWLNVTGNGVSTGTSRVCTRLTGATTDGNNCIFIPASTTGKFIDSADVDTVNSDDRWHFRFYAGPGSGNISLSEGSLQYLATNNTVSRIVRASNAGGLTNGTSYWAYSSTESWSQLYTPTAGKAANLGIKVGANTNTKSISVVSRVNGANGNMNFTIPNNTTGIFQDKANSDTLNPGDLFTVQYSTPGTAGTGTAVFYNTAFDFVTTTNDSIIGFMNGNVNFTGTPRFAPISTMADNNTESNIPIQFTSTATVKNLYTNISGNATTGTSTYLLRRNNANTALSASIGTGVNGWVGDTTDTIPLVSTDNVNAQFSRGSAANITVQGFVIQFNFAQTSTGASPYRRIIINQ